MKELAPNTLVDGRYLVERKIGAGGMAVVYRVRHRTLGTPMALKLLTIANASVAARLLQEGKVQAALRHPNIVSVVDQIEVDGAVGLVMEFVRGPSLADLLDRMRLDPAQVDDLARGLFDGVEFAHLAGVVHRDLKPANVLVELAPGRLIPKIADFGLVKLLAPGDVTEVAGRTRTGTTFGTPEYMAPEQISDVKGVDVRADVWSVGVMLFELLTGRKPFEDDDLLELFNKVAKGRRAGVAELVPGAPRRMVEAIEAALVPDRARRLPDIAAFRARWCEGQVHGPSAPWSDQAMEEIRRLSKHESAAAILDASFTEDGRATMVPPSGIASVALTSPSLAAVEEAPHRRRLLAGVVLLLGGSTAMLGAGVVGLWAGLALLAAGPEAPPSDPRPSDPRPSDARPSAAPEAGPSPPPAPEATSAAPPEPARSAAREVASPPPSRPPPVAAPAEPVPAPGSPEAGSPEAGSPEAGSPERASPAPEPAAAAPAPPPPNPVVVLGSQPHVTVSLVDPLGHVFDLGAPPPGIYTVVAFFRPGVGTRNPQPVRLEAGGRYVVTCSTTKETCKVEGS